MVVEPDELELLDEEELLDDELLEEELLDEELLEEDELLDDELDPARTTAPNCVPSLAPAT